MDDPCAVLLGPTSREARQGALEAVLRSPDAGQRLEAALPDLLREGEEDLLLRLVQGLTPLAGRDPAARRVLEVLSRRAGSTRAAALSALRGSSRGPGASQPG